MLKKHAALLVLVVLPLSFFVWTMAILTTNVSVGSSKHPDYGPFSSYSASPAEEAWLQSPKQSKICRTALKYDQIQAAKAWLSFSEAAFAPRRRPPQPPNSTQSHSLSFMNYRNFSEPIEPLHGIGRHPFARVGCRDDNVQDDKLPSETDLFDITYLILRNMCGADGTPAKSTGRNVLFDLGCSVGFQGFEETDGIPDKPPRLGSGIGGSLPLFYKLFHDRCIDFDRIYGWEVTQYPPSDWWGTLPPNLRSRVHYYNLPVDEKPVTSNGRSKTNPTSFLSLLRSAVTPEDYVVVKVDIDTPALEERIVNSIADDDSLAVLVDELLFEYHYSFDGLDFGWGLENSKSVDTALKLFRKLREKGVRSHFWI